MNNGDHNLDKLFKDAFDGEKHDFKAAYWQDAQQMLNAGKSTPIFTKPYMMVSALSIAISSILFFADSTPNQFIHTSNQITENQQKNSTPSLSTTQQNSSSINYVQDNSVSTGKSKTQNPVYQTNKHVTPTINAELDTEQKQNLSHSDSDQNKKDITVIEGKSSNKLSSQQVITTEEEIKTSANSFKVSSEAVPTAIVSTSISSKSVSTENSKKSNPDQFTQKRITENIAHISKAEELKGKTTRGLVNDMNIKEQALSMMQTKSLILTKQNDWLTIPSSDYMPLKPIHLPLTLRLSAGNYWSESLNAGSSNVQTYAQNINIEFSAEYLFKPNWGIQVGISYNNVVEEQAHRGLGVIDNSYWNEIDNSYWTYEQQQITIQDSTWWLGGWWHYAPYQDTLVDSTYISQHDKQYVTKYDTAAKNFKSQQNIKLIEVPVLISYNFNIERWTFQVASGMSFGIYSNSNGQIIRPGDPIRLENSNSSLFNNIQYNYLLHTELGYNVTDHWQLTARPQLKMNLNSIYKNESGFQQRYLFYGVNVGVAYRF